MVWYISLDLIWNRTLCETGQKELVIEHPALIILRNASLRSSSGGCLSCVSLLISNRASLRKSPVRETDFISAINQVKVKKEHFSWHSETNCYYSPNFQFKINLGPYWQASTKMKEASGGCSLPPSVAFSNYVHLISYYVLFLWGVEFRDKMFCKESPLCRMTTAECVYAVGVMLDTLKDGWGGMRH